MDIGTSQCGKSTKSIAQDLEWEGSLVSNDIKREMRNKTAGWRSLRGPTFTIDTTGRENRFDPLEGHVTERQLYDMAYLLLYNPNDKETYFTERVTRMLTLLFLAAREETILLRRYNPSAREVRPLPYVGRITRFGINKVAAILNGASPFLAEQFLEEEYDPLRDYENASKARSDAF